MTVVWILAMLAAADAPLDLDAAGRILAKQVAGKQWSQAAETARRIERLEALQKFPLGWNHQRFGLVERVEAAHVVFPVALAAAPQPVDAGLAAGCDGGPEGTHDLPRLL